MSNQASVRSIDSLKDLRTALALYADDTVAALGAVDGEIRRTLRWLQEDRPAYWHDQIKRRRELVQMAKAEVFKRQLQQRADHKPSIAEQMDALKKAEQSLADAEKRLIAVRKWQHGFKQAALEYHGSAQRLKTMAAGDLPNAVLLLERIIDSLEAYLAVQPPSSVGTDVSSGPAIAPAEFVAIANRVIDADEQAQPAAPEKNEENPATDVDTLFAASPGSAE
jgi:hypothetical protein